MHAGSHAHTCYTKVLCVHFTSCSLNLRPEPQERKLFANVMIIFSFPGEVINISTVSIYKVEMSYCLPCSSLRNTLDWGIKQNFLILWCCLDFFPIFDANRLLIHSHPPFSWILHGRLEWLRQNSLKSDWKQEQLATHQQHYKPNHSPPELERSLGCSTVAQQRRRSKAEERRGEKGKIASFPDSKAPVVLVGGVWSTSSSQEMPVYLTPLYL